MGDEIASPAVICITLHAVCWRARNDLRRVDDFRTYIQRILIHTSDFCTVSAIPTWWGFERKDCYGGRSSLLSGKDEIASPRSSHEFLELPRRLAMTVRRVDDFRNYIQRILIHTSDFCTLSAIPPWWGFELKDWSGGRSSLLCCKDEIASPRSSHEFLELPRRLAMTVQKVDDFRTYIQWMPVQTSDFFTVTAIPP